MQDNSIKKLSEKDHLLQRPGMYIGQVTQTTKEMFVLQSDKFKIKDNTFIPGLIKIINEIVDNSVDEFIRTKGEYANKINISINNNTVCIEDNGRGIPVIKEETTNEWGPVLAWTHARAGANFSNNSDTIGTNGVGSFATNVFSELFIGETSDGSNKLTLTCKNNLDSMDVVVSKSNKRFTKVTFKPDLARFNIDNIDDIHMNIIKQRIFFLSVSYPNIKFTFNDEIISAKLQDFFSMFGTNFEYLESKCKKYTFCFLPNELDDFRSLSLINGLVVPDGGMHIDVVMWNVINGLRDKISKKYKEIKPGDIKNKIMVVCILNNFTNAVWDSQTKEKLTNSQKDVNQYFGEIDYDKLVNKLYKNEAIMFPILETYKIKEELKNRALLKDMSKPLKEDADVYGYLPPTQNYKYIVFCEGDAAKGGLMPVLGRKDFGYYPLKGVPLNTYQAESNKISANQEIKDMVKILGFDLSKINTDCTYDKILIASDQDADGTHIRGILLTYFFKYARPMLEAGRICFLRTPLIVAKQKNKIIKQYFSFEEYIVDKDENYEFDYKKGLGSWTSSELKYLIEKNGIDTYIERFELGDGDDIQIDNWMNKSKADVRKEMLKDVSINLFKI